MKIRFQINKEEKKSSISELLFIIIHTRTRSPIYWFWFIVFIIMIII